MVDKWRGSFVRLAVKLDQYPLDIKQEAIDSIQEPPRLQVLGGSATGGDHYQRIGIEIGSRAHSHRDAVFFDDIPNAVPVSGNRSKTKQTKGGVATIGGGEDRSVQNAPTVIGEDAG